MSKPKDLRIVEGVMGYWSYHLAEPGKYTAICGGGGTMMHTAIPLKHWGKPCGNRMIHFKWCTECRELSYQRSE